MPKARAPSNALGDLFSFFGVDKKPARERPLQGLFDGPAPRVRAIPADAPFLETLVDALLKALPANDPLALADAIIFLPNRRASAGLIEAFAKKLGGAALLPAIRPLGDIGDDPEVWGPELLDFDLPPAIDPLRRRLELARLVRAREAAEGGVDDPVRALALADELTRLLDSAATADAVDWSLLPTLVEERDLAAHWQRSARFLEIVSTYWPQRLALEGLCDPGQRSAMVLERLADLWREAPPERPVLIAGSTGSVAATRKLMRSVAALPKGCVILPGLDIDLDDAPWEALEPHHPQFALARTLKALGMERGNVAGLGRGRAPERRELIREALLPASATAAWRERLLQRDGGAGPFLAAGTAGLRAIEARNEEEEAQTVALLLREAYETPGRTAALVTPDAKLAQRVAAKLARWRIEPMLSMGAPLGDTPVGVLLLLLAELATDAAQPIPLLALLKHPFTRLGRPRAELLAAVAALERAAMRGPRRWADLEGLAAFTQAEAELVRDAAAALAPLQQAAARKDLDCAVFAEAWAEAAERMAEGDHARGADRIWAGPEGAAAAGLVRQIAECGAELGPLEPRDILRAARTFMSGREAPPERGGDPRIAILTPLEARLVRRDLYVLGGLVEGVWPKPPPEDPFLSRSMRKALGLPDPDERIGLAAHDFAQLANGAEVVLVRSARRGGAPAVASRWIWRLETLLRAGGGENRLAYPEPLAWSRALDRPRTTIRLAAPEPRPPAEARNFRISFSSVEKLVRDPYAIYAQRILGLEALAAPGAEPGARERGTAVHAALERFGEGDDPRELLRLLDEALGAWGFSREVRRTERARMKLSAETYARWNSERVAAGFTAHREIPGRLDLGGGRFLTGVADRIDIRPDGWAEITDYKTGAPPTKDQVKAFLSPQMTLEAAVLAAAGFDGLGNVRSALVHYWRFGGSDPAMTTIDGADEEGEKALGRLQGLLLRYADPNQPFLSKPRVKFLNAWDEHDHFARRAEWADAGGEGGG